MADDHQPFSGQFAMSLAIAIIHADIIVFAVEFE